MSKALVLVTYNREDLLKQVIESIDPKQFESIVIVKDGGGKPYDEKVEEVLAKNFIYFPQSENLGVGRCKQLGIDYVLENTKADHIFVVEDDVLILDNDVWDYYIEFSNRSGVWHTNWNDFRYKSVKFEVDYDGFKGLVTRDVLGSFSYFHRNVFKFCTFPVDMKNAFEHISVELQLIEKHLLPPFWNFICPKGSENYLRDIGKDSTITDKPNYTENYQNSMKAFSQRHGLTVNKIPDSTPEVVLEKLKFLKENYGKKV